MKLAPFFLFYFTIFAFVPSVFSKTPDSTTSSFIFSVQELLFNDQFDAADSLCEKFIADNAASPVGYLFKAGSQLGEMSDQEEALHSQELRKLVDSVITLCDKGLETSTDSDAAYLYLWRGHAHVYRSLFESHFGSFTSAIKHGFKAHDDYQKGLGNDSILYDLYFGLGNYHYWKSVKAGILRTIGIISNEIKKGINELGLAADSGIYFQEAAQNSMIWIWLDKKEYDSVIVLAEKMLKKYPDSRTLRWPLAAAYFQSGEFEKSGWQYQILWKHFEQNRGNYFNLIECEYHLHECYKQLGFKKKADEILAKVNNYGSDIPKSTKKRQRAKLNYLRRELAR